MSKFQTDDSHTVVRVYLVLLLFNTLATSLIWGINTLFLLDAGLTNFQAFTVNAFFTLGQVLFEVPTGVVADSFGRRLSYLLGAVTLAVSTALYYVAWTVGSGMAVWLVASIILGLGYTFFSGATEAWLVDALEYTEFEGDLDGVFAKGQVVSGAAMLVGSVLGGVLAQWVNLGLPYLVRAAILGITFGLAWLFMKDLGFSPETAVSVRENVKDLLRVSVRSGLRKPSIRYVVLSAPFVTGASYYVFYALQPYLLELWGDPEAYIIAGLTAAIMAGSQMAGGFSTPYLRKVVARRTSMLLLGVAGGVGALVGVGIITNFYVVLGLIVVWGILYAAMMPARQAYLNAQITSKQRATVLSFDALVSSGGGAVSQPVLGRVADMAGYPASYVVSGVVQAFAVPLLWLARREGVEADMVGE